MKFRLLELGKPEQPSIETITKHGLQWSKESILIGSKGTKYPDRLLAEGFHSPRDGGHFDQVMESASFITKEELNHGNLTKREAELVIVAMALHENSIKVPVMYEAGIPKKFQELDQAQNAVIFLQDNYPNSFIQKELEEIRTMIEWTSLEIDIGIPTKENYKYGLAKWIDLRCGFGNNLEEMTALSRADLMELNKAKAKDANMHYANFNIFGNINLDQDSITAHRNSFLYFVNQKLDPWKTAIPEIGHVLKGRMYEAGLI